MEKLILERSHAVNIVGIEVPSCVNKYLPEPERMLRVDSTASLHPEALLAEALLFCYPRETLLIQRYLSEFVGGALHTVIVLTHHDDYPRAEAILVSFFDKVEIIKNCGLPDFEVLAVARFE